MQNWSNSKKWDEAWFVERDLDSGGQAAAKLVKNRLTGEVAFLKVLNRQNDFERRARFFREATAYGTVGHPLIPKLVESNAHYHEDLEYKLYLIADYVNGITLRQYVDKNGGISFSDATEILFKLIEAVSYCHAHEWIHRDIKPDNIILRNSNPSDPFLLDFGISYSQNFEEIFKTDDEQELGNRFLRLPEMSSGSSVKNDIRTDISFLGGIYFYLLTGGAPFVLVDADGKMPHQREMSAKKLRGAFTGDFFQLANFFDKCFSHRFSGRFLNTHQLGLALQGLIAASHDKQTTPPNIDQIVLSLQSTKNLELARNKHLYDLVMTRITSVHARILQKIQPTYASYQTGYINFVDGLRNDLGFAHFATHEQRFVPSFLIKIMGDELVVLANDVSIFRTEVESPVFSLELDDAIESVYLNGLSELIKGL